MEILRSVAVEGDRAVIIVTHDSRVLEFGDRIARMEDGHIIAVEDKNQGERPLPGHFTADTSALVTAGTTQPIIEAPPVTRGV
jgi:ABC-type multidrug transport system ATPase subunit